MTVAPFSSSTSAGPETLAGVAKPPLVTVAPLSSSEASGSEFSRTIVTIFAASTATADSGLALVIAAPVATSCGGPSTLAVEMPASVAASAVPGKLDSAFFAFRFSNLFLFLFLLGSAVGALVGSMLVVAFVVFVSRNLTFARTVE